MAAKKRRMTCSLSAQAVLVKQMERFFDEIAPDLVKRLTSAETRASHAETELARLQLRLTTLLNKEQLEAVKICGTTPEDYAIECIELYKEKFFPHFAPDIRPLAALRSGQI